MSSAEQLKPQSLRREGNGLLIDWNDGVRTFVSWADLRKQCPCATCIDERAKPPNPLRILSDRELAAGTPAPVQMLARGYYAYQIIWNDGHDTGIYSLELLRELGTPVSPDGKE
jgi:DUF971 family protein